MDTRYSPGTRAFYPHDIDYGSNLPGDLIDVSQADYEAAMAARAAGNDVDFVNGKLVITPPAPVPFAEESAPFMAEVRATRELILNRLPGMWMAAQAAGDAATSSVIVNARQALLDITKRPEVLGATTMEELRAAVKAAYKSITAGVPESVRSAFNRVDA